MVQVGMRNMERCEESLTELFSVNDHVTRLPDIQAPIVTSGRIMAHDFVTPMHRRRFYNTKFWTPMKSVSDDFYEGELSERAAYLREATWPSTEPDDPQRRRLFKSLELCSRDGDFLKNRRREIEENQASYPEEEIQLYKVIHREPTCPEIHKCPRFEEHHLHYLLQASQPSRPKYQHPNFIHTSFPHLSDEQPARDQPKSTILRPTPVQSITRRLEFEVLLMSTGADRTTVLGRHVVGLSARKAKARETAVTRPWRTWRPLNAIKKAEDTKELVNKVLRRVETRQRRVLRDEIVLPPPPSPSDSTDYKSYSQSTASQVSPYSREMSTCLL